MDIWVAITLIVFGLIFLVLEIFVFPGIGISGIVGIISLIAGVLISFKISTNYGMLASVSSLAIAGFALWFSVKSKAFSKMFLSQEIDGKVNLNHLSEVTVEQEGISISRIAPMGKARFNDYYCEVTSWEGFIDEHTPIKIVKIDNNTIFVTPKI